MWSYCERVAVTRHCTIKTILKLLHWLHYDASRIEFVFLLCFLCWDVNNVKKKRNSLSLCVSFSSSSLYFKDRKVHKENNIIPSVNICAWLTLDNFYQHCWLFISPHHQREFDLRIVCVYSHFFLPMNLVWFLQKFWLCTWISKGQFFLYNDFHLDTVSAFCCNLAPWNQQDCESRTFFF